MDTELGALNYADNLEGLLKVISSKNLRHIYGNKIFEKNYLMSKTLKGVKNEIYHNKKFQENNKLIGKFLSEKLNEVPINFSNINKLLGSIKMMSKSNIDSIQNIKPNKKNSQEGRIYMQKHLFQKEEKILPDSVEKKNLKDLKNNNLCQTNTKFYIKKNKEGNENSLFLTAINSFKNKNPNTDNLNEDDLTTKKVKIKNTPMRNSFLYTNFKTEKIQNNVDNNPNELLEIKKNYENLCSDFSKTNSRFKKCDSKIEKIRSNLLNLEKNFKKLEQKSSNFERKMESRKRVCSNMRNKQIKIIETKSRTKSGTKEIKKNNKVKDFEIENFKYHKLSFSSYCDTKLKNVKNNETSRNKAKYCDYNFLKFD